jgi:DNA-binding NtrC family response regulator
MVKQHRILIVEDEARWREDVLREALEDEGYQVQTSSSYDEAVAALDRQAFDLAVVDVNLTGVSGNQDGIRLLERLASHHTQTQTIVISGSRTRAMAAESAKRFRPYAFVDKTTFDFVEFVNMVMDALASPRQKT